MRIVVATVRTPFVYGGAEVLADGLVKALIAEGHEADVAAVPFSPLEAERIPDQMLASRLLDLRVVHGARVDRLIALKFPAYLIPHPEKVVWLLHQHRAAYDLYDHPVGGLRKLARGETVRDIIQRADQQLAAEARGIFTISRTVTERLQRYSKIEGPPLYHPPTGAEEFYCAEEPDEYFFFPSRVTPTKRQELVIEALAFTKQPVRVRFAGLPDSPAYGENVIALAQKLGVSPRVEWAGFLTETEKRDAYARALAVLFPPLDEDYGYVTLEAMLASKAVVSCSDSGGPLEFLVHEQTGIVTAPKPKQLAAALDQLWQDRALARQLGQNGRRHYEGMELSWSNVVRSLLE
jgi:glycosyltransferase involved in cell wall biosynthesis